MAGTTSLIKVVIADDHKLIRAGLNLMLRSFGGVQVIGESGDGLEALELIRERRPDIALLDISMPGLTGVEIAQRLRTEYPEVRVIILSMYSNPEFVARALRAGVCGYLLKGSDPRELELAIQAALKGDTFFSPRIPKAPVDEYLRRADSEGSSVDQLTPRQRQVLQMLAEGKNNKTIAGFLGVSVKTVETHRAKLMDRIGVRDIAGLVRFAIRTGVIEPW